MGERATGTAKWFNSTKGFGFIAIDSGPYAGEEVFVHQSQLKAQGYRSLAEGEPLEFDVQVEGDGRKKAVNVTGPGGADVKGEESRGGYGGGGGQYGGGGGGQYGGGGYGGGGQYGGGGYSGGGYGGRGGGGGSYGGGQQGYGRGGYGQGGY